MNNMIALNIWDRPFEVYVSYQNYPGEVVTDSQKDVLEIIKTFNFDIVKNNLIEYIKKNYMDCMDEAEINNIFRYIIPKSVLITREEEHRVFALMCKFKFDVEHGLAIVVKDENLYDIGPQDIIL